MQTSKNQVLDSCKPGRGKKLLFTPPMETIIYQGLKQTEGLKSCSLKRNNVNLLGKKRKTIMGK